MKRLFVSFATILALASSTVAFAVPQIPKEPRLTERISRLSLPLMDATRTNTAVRTDESQTESNFEVLGHLELPGGSPHGDVFFYDHGGEVGDFAYVGTWSAGCASTGVKIIDVNDPTNPTLAALATTGPGESTEDIAVERIGGRDIMATGVQICGDGGQGGLALFDVTDPSNPSMLSFLEMPAGGVHELDLVVRSDGQALALMAVPFVEFENTYFGANAGGEFRIADITDPSNPVELADWGAIADSSLQIFGGNDEISSSFQGLGIFFPAIYAHSPRAADDGMTAYVSYWDAGVLKFDISDPANPALLARTFFDYNVDGDAHSMTPYDVDGHRYILQNDEDFDPLTPNTILTSATGDQPYAAIDMPFAPTVLLNVGNVSAPVHDAGDGCQRGDYLGAQGKIALADTVDPFYVGIIPDWTVPCDIGVQARFAFRAGAQAFVSNLVSPDDAYPFFPAVDPGPLGNMPVVQISDIDELADQIRASLAAGEVVNARLHPHRPSHGFLRVYDEQTASDVNGDGTPEYSQVGSFTDLPFVTGTLETPPGTWSIHNTEVNAARSYSSWYSHGIVALQLGQPTRPRLAGQFVPPPSSNFPDVFGPPHALVWGVAIDYETSNVYASDMRSGLWIVRPTGPAAP